MLEPVTNHMLSELVPNLAWVHFFGKDGADAVRSNGAPEPDAQAVRIPAPRNGFDPEVSWFAHVPVADWNQPGKTTESVLVVTTRPFAVMNIIFGDQFDYGQDGLWGLVIVAILFLSVEMLSLFTGISLTRTITGAVHDLYEGTQKVTAGDFSHRIEVSGHDQLADLGRSFNSMTENLERLFVVEKEKERLQSELEIAQGSAESALPQGRADAAHAWNSPACASPARMVSGDYYDFLCLRFQSRRARHRRRGGQGHLGGAADGVDPIHHAHAAHGRISAFAAAAQGRSTRRVLHRACWSRS